jgi:hypothetical protein
MCDILTLCFLETVRNEQIMSSSTSSCIYSKLVEEFGRERVDEWAKQMSQRGDDDLAADPEVSLFFYKLKRDVRRAYERLGVEWRDAPTVPRRN